MTQAAPNDQAALLDLGDGGAAGVYLLRIEVVAASLVRFGRFARGKAIEVTPGTYLYVGSALNGQGKPALARRVLRHLTRTDPQPPHALRRLAAAHFDLAPPATKQLRWHIDYLLDKPHVEVDQIIVLRTPRARPFSGEAEVAHRLNQLVGCHPLAPGLGASDDPGSTHLLCWRGTHEQWQQTIAWLAELPPQWNRPSAGWSNASGSSWCARTSTGCFSSSP
jgi:Uri superfamily endonuclease